MDDLIATHLFVQLDDFAKRAKNENQPGKTLQTENEKWLFRLKNRDQDRKLTLPEAACLLMLFQLSTCKSLKAFLFISSGWLRPLFPTLPSYGSCVAWLAKTEPFLVDFLGQSMAKPGEGKAVYAVDSTKIDPHKLKNNPKCLRAQARAGHSHEGVWIGWKLHLVVNRQGKIMGWDLTPGNVHDLAPVKGGLLKKLSGICFADSGYVSGQTKQDLLPQGLLFIAKPTKAMADDRWIFDRFWAKTYRQRQIVEGAFSKLKDRLGLVFQGARSPASARCRALASLVLHCLGF